MELDEALDRISEIRGHLARTEVFRGYRALPIALSGVLALVVGAIQTILLPRPAAEPWSWLGLWLGTAAISLVLWGAELTARYARTTSGLERERIRLAVGRFLPSIAGGGVVTLAFARFAPGNLALLPGIWAVFMSVGTFASLPQLPRPIVAVAGWYLVSGAAVFGAARGEHAFAPLAMALVFGIGQLLAAAILWFTLERPSHEA